MAKQDMELISQLKEVQNTLLRFSNIAANKKQVEHDKRLDLYAVAVFRAINILNDKGDSLL